MHLSFLLLMRTSGEEKHFEYIVGSSFLATFDFQKDESLLLLSLLVLVLVFVWAHSEVIFSSAQERAWRG